MAVNSSSVDVPVLGAFPYGLTRPDRRAPGQSPAPPPVRRRVARDFAGPRPTDPRQADPRQSVCWQCRASLDCEIARMCLAHPTGATRLAAVVRAIKAMRAGIAEPLSLTKLANAAMLSPFHFHRVFRHVTATTPARYLAALRMAEAKRLLTETQLNVTEICAEVGYSSLGTFTTQFTRHVGLSPSRYRNAVAAWGHVSLRAVVERYPQPAGRIAVTGRVTGGPGHSASAAVALFHSAIPQGQPVAGTVVAVPGPVRLVDVPDGDYHPLAMWLDERASIARALREATGPFGFVGTSGALVPVRQGRARAPFEIGLRPFHAVDPPIVYAAPLLLAIAVLGEDAQVVARP
jgi:AraC-like DNA-binding protein